MSYSDETLEREFKEKCKKHLFDKRDKELRDLRDHFAGLALSGIFANHLCNPETDEHHNNIAQIAYRAADAMLKQRSLTND